MARLGFPVEDLKLSLGWTSRSGHVRLLGVRACRVRIPTRTSSPVRAIFRHVTSTRTRQLTYRGTMTKGPVRRLPERLDGEGGHLAQRQSEAYPALRRAGLRVVWEYLFHVPKLAAGLQTAEWPAMSHS